MRFNIRYIALAIFIGVLIGVFFVYKTRSDTAITTSAALNIAEFGNVSLRIEYATTTTARELGLRGRMNVPDDYGMLFVFEKNGYYGFWMKDMLVPLDMFWLDDKGQVISIVADVATSSYPTVFYPVAPVRYVLETIAGFAREHQIDVGITLGLQNFPTVTE